MVRSCKYDEEYTLYPRLTGNACNLTGSLFVLTELKRYAEPSALTSAMICYRVKETYKFEIYPGCLDASKIRRAQQHGETVLVYAFPRWQLEKSPAHASIPKLALTPEGFIMAIWFPTRPF
jgi:hypothetical protein